MAISLFTTTSYGTWLPGDLRGYVDRGVILPGNPRLLRYSKSLLTKEPVLFAAREQDDLFAALLAASQEFGYRLTDASVESWLLHWIVFHGEDSLATVVGRLKNRMRQALNRGRIWTRGYCGRALRDEVALEQVRKYIAHHDGCRMSAGKLIRSAQHALSGRKNLQLSPGHCPWGMLGYALPNDLQCESVAMT